MSRIEELISTEKMTDFSSFKNLKIFKFLWRNLNWWSSRKFTLYFNHFNFIMTLNKKLLNLFRWAFNLLINSHSFEYQISSFLWHNLVSITLLQKSPLLQKSTLIHNDNHNEHTLNISYVEEEHDIQCQVQNSNCNEWV